MKVSHSILQVKLRKAVTRREQKDGVASYHSSWPRMKDVTCEVNGAGGFQRVASEVVAR